ncbi:hypothetical protein ACFQZ2_00040 [Streptomonospora algeriensis]|uniref:Cytochrome P450 n=1 Tax=Streptomonospora algeriensis TaxID=995084 RepID=A0ABW3B9K7_9ACTN
MTIDPFPLYAHTGPPSELWPSLRARYPSGIAPVMLDPHTSAWLLLSWETNKQVFRDPLEVYSVHPRWWREGNDGTVPETSGLKAMYRPRDNARHHDGGRHRHYRQALETALGAIDQRRLLTDVDEAADLLIARFAPRGWADLIEDYATQLSAMALTRLLSLDDEAGARACAAMRRLWDGGGGGDALHGWLDLYAVLVESAKHQRDVPGDGVIAGLIAAGHTDDEVADQASLIVSTTHDPGTHLIGNTLRALLTDRTLRGEVSGARTRIGDALDLTLVRDSPVRTLIGRWPRAEHRIGDYTIHQGDMVVFGLESAHQDLIDKSGLAHPEGAPAYIACDTQALGAGTRAHLAWGVGAHQCPYAGRDIATTIAEHAIGRLLAHLPDVALAVDSTALVRRMSLSINGLERLPVQFHPTSSIKEETWLSPARPSPSHPASATPTSPRTSSPMARLFQWMFREG